MVPGGSPVPPRRDSSAPMQIRALAERILFGADIDEDKLFAPDTVEDDAPGGPIALPPGPARPRGLRFEDRPDRRFDLPGPKALEEDALRGRLLHAFANHELLAMELMALMLLRFPEAPAPFRRGLVRIIGEEQAHLRLYRGRMEALGVGLGEVPVNDFFWRVLAPAATPMDFVVGMSLVLEQANLDFALHYGRLFRQIGDAPTADVMDQVHQDEVGHVKHGLHWFRRWKDPAESDWEAFDRRLRLPLSPARAKGEGFDRAVREEIGFDADFIDRLAVFGRSRGRPPTVFLFNPACEAEICHVERGHGPQSFTPALPVATLARDLATLPMAFAAEGDVVLVPEEPDPAFLSTLSAAGFTLPEWVSPAGLAGLAERKLGRLEPWGWSPVVAQQLAPLAAQVSHGRRGWEPAWAELAAKTWSVAERPALVAALDDPRVVDVPARVCRSAEEAAAAVEALLPLTGQVVMKSRLGSSGQGALRVEAPLQAKERAWLAHTLPVQGAVVVEPWLDRRLDLSFHFDLEPGGHARWRGALRFEADRRGQFTGLHLGLWNEGLDAALVRFLHEGDRRWLSRVGQRVMRHLAPRLAAAGHSGPVGVDALVFQGPDGLRLHPFVELNPRFTMGRLGLHLQAHLAPGRVGRWRIVPLQQVERAGYAGFVDWAAAQRLRAPLRMKDGHIEEGALLTTDPARARRFATLLEVSRPQGPAYGPAQRPAQAPEAEP